MDCLLYGLMATLLMTKRFLKFSAFDASTRGVFILFSALRFSI